MENDKKLLLESANLMEKILKDYEKQKKQLEHKKKIIPKIFKNKIKEIDNQIKETDKNIKHYNQLYLKQCKYLYKMDKRFYTSDVKTNEI